MSDSQAAARSGRPLILHVLYRFATGGLENGVVNLINRLPHYRHAVLALDQCDSGFCQRVTRNDVEYISLHKPPGQTLKMAPRFLRELKRLQPDIVHTRNLAALEMQLPTWWAGVGARVHGEHGWDVNDLNGESMRGRVTRRLYRPFVHHFVALAGDQASYLKHHIGVPAARVHRICNGVDLSRFDVLPGRQPLEGSPFNDMGLFVIGTVGRMQAVKAQTVLVEAFIQAVRRAPELRARLRLLLAGDGPLRGECAALLDAAGMSDLAWLAGERRDVPAVMRHLDLFVLPSLAEGISNTILEAMACGRAVLATRVGGNSELVEQGVTGEIVEAGTASPLAEQLLRMAQSSEWVRAMGQAGRFRVEQHFSLVSMVNAYDSLYRGLLGGRINT